MDESMEISQDLVDQVWSEEPEAAPAAEEPAADQPAAEPGGDGTEREQVQPEPETPPELFTIKNRDEQRQVTREELVSMAQKGWDYDRVRQERDQLRQYRTENDPSVELIKRYADRSGMSVGEYLDYCRKQELIAGGMSEQEALQKVGLDRERAELDRERRELDAHRQQMDSVRQRAQAQAQARQQDVEQFYRTYPKVDPKSIPQEVWDAVKAGESLTNAYTMHENRRLAAELAAERQNRKNRETAPGSLAGEETESQADLISRYWDEV